MLSAIAGDNSMSEASHYERQNFALVHWQGREGIIYRLGPKKSSSFGPLTHSIAQTLALVHDLRLESLQFRFHPDEYNPDTILPNDVQLVFSSPDKGSYLGISAFVCSSRALGNVPLILLGEIGEYLDGILKRKRDKIFSDITEEKLERNLLGYYEGELFGNWDPIQDTKLQNFATRPPSKITGYWDKELELTGFYEFPGAYAQGVRICSRNHEWNSSKSAGCPLCHELEYEERPPLLAMPSMNFFKKQNASIRPSDLLRYIIQWPRLGTFFVRTLINEEQVWGKGFIKFLLLPTQMVFSTEQQKYIATLWKYKKNEGLKVAILQSAEDKPGKNPRKLIHYWHLLGKMKWDAKRLSDIGLEQVIDQEKIGFADKGELIRVNSSLVEHLDGLVE